jgi:AcrR family transcriptional regulator
LAKRRLVFKKDRAQTTRCSHDAIQPNQIVIENFLKIVPMPSQSAATLRKPRSDGVRNRERVLEAAKTVFSAGGSEASLEAVAKRAGVGIGTLYRHFPTREALFEAVYRREVDQLSDLAEKLKSAPEPVDALRLWLKANVELVATKKGMISALALAVQASSELYAYSFESLTKAIGTLLDRAVAAGEIRADIKSEDLLRALIGMCYLHDQPGWQSTVLRLMDVFINGLRVHPDGGGKATSSSQRAHAKKSVKRARKR